MAENEIICTPYLSMEISRVHRLKTDVGLGFGVVLFETIFQSLQATYIKGVKQPRMSINMSISEGYQYIYINNDSIVIRH